MATYKVLQDIEAEDKLFGPLTLKQFIFAGIFIAIGFVLFTLITSGAPSIVKIPLISVMLLPMIVFGFLAAPIGQDQPNDVWLLARLRFLLKPHNRIWNQDGISELVTITAPKREVHIYSNGLSQNEVKSRLQALANTMDSRGWAVKNVTTNMFAQPGYLSQGTNSDRLIDPSTMPQDVPAAVVTASDDILDTDNNPVAQHLNQLVQASTQAHKQQAISHMKQGSAAQPTPQDYYFMNQSPAPQTPLPGDYARFSSQKVVTPGASDDVLPAAKESDEEHALAEKLQLQNHPNPNFNPHIKTLNPLHDRDGNMLPQSQQAPAKTQTTTSNPAILGLAHNDDLNVATIARQAQKLSEGDDEVVISLH